MLKGGLSYGLIQKFAVLYLVVWTISPPLQIDLIFRIAALACAAIWFLIMFIRDSSVSLDESQFYSIIFLIAVIGVVYLEKRSFSVILKQIAYILLVVCYLMNRYYREKWDELSGIVPIIMILFIIFNAITIKALVEDPTIARRLVRDDESIYEYWRQGVGGYGLIYPQVCISPIILAWVIKAFKEHKIYFIIGIVWLITFVWFLGIAGYSIAIFASVIGAIILLVYRGKSVVLALVVSSVFFILIMFSILYITGFREWLLEIFDGTAVAKKINDLVSTGATGETGDSIQIRIDRYWASIFNAIKYPIIGSLWRANGGGHSAFLDTLSKYGILGTMMFSEMFYATPMYYKKYYENQFITSAANATLIALIFVSFLDSFSYQFTCIILVIAPLFFEDIIKWTGAEKNESFMDS